ncbi:vitelline membrane outer layer protein 1 homolog [Panulirus ornatus]|uniref:vitelline membrane outer layer protein 1 homolog n=1 Tax=Panulirus ornatus TaxID=150431 RepID=UPI003A86366B
MKAPLLLLPLLALGAVGAPEPLTVVENINLDNGLPRGEWGRIDLCPEGSFAFAFEIKYSGVGFLDDTSVNAIRLYCEDRSGTLTGYTISSEGNYGQWRGMRSCGGTGDLLVGMMANVVPDLGTFGDDLGMDNLRMECSNGTVLDGINGDPSRHKEPLITRSMVALGEREVEAVHLKIEKSALARDYGDWGSWARCSPNNRICGHQSRLEPEHVIDDDAGITDVVMFCCNFS